MIAAPGFITRAAAWQSQNMAKMLVRNTRSRSAVGMSAKLSKLIW